MLQFYQAENCKLLANYSVLLHLSFTPVPGLLKLLRTFLSLILLLAEQAIERLLDQIDQLAQHPEEVSEAKTPTANANGVDEEVHQHPVRADEDQEYTEVPPFLAGVDVQSVQILIADRVWAVLAVLICPGVKKVTTSGLRKLSCILATGLPWWRIEVTGL